VVSLAEAPAEVVEPDSVSLAAEVVLLTEAPVEVVDSVSLAGAEVEQVAQDSDSLAVELGDEPEVVGTGLSEVSEAVVGTGVPEVFEAEEGTGMSSEAVQVLQPSEALTLEEGFSVSLVGTGVGEDSEAGGQDSPEQTGGHKGPKQAVVLGFTSLEVGTGLSVVTAGLLGAGADSVGFGRSMVLDDSSPPLLVVTGFRPSSDESEEGLAGLMEVVMMTSSVVGGREGSHSKSVPEGLGGGTHSEADSLGGMAWLRVHSGSGRVVYSMVVMTEVTRCVFATTEEQASAATRGRMPAKTTKECMVGQSPACCVSNK
jgi:hypothetical protein